MSGIKGDIELVSSHLTVKQEGFDKAMDLSRRLVRIAAQSITYMHNGKKDEAKKRLAEAKGLLLQLTDMKDFYYHTLQSMQEYAEAMIFFEVKFSGRIPAKKVVGVPDDAYVMGLMDVVGELKRELIDSLSKGSRRDADRYYSTMVEIFDSTREIRFAEAVLPGFRRKQDVARIQLESAASEMLRTKGQ